MPASAPDPVIQRLAAPLESVVREAGAIALGYFRSGVRTWTKADSSVVTEGDIAVDRFLSNRLPGLLPGSGWLSEEIADTPDRLDRDHVWVVDPIDGTRAFSEGIPMWVVSVALVRQGRPILAAIFNPVAGEYFAATSGGGASLNGEPLAASPRDVLTGARVSGPRALFERLEPAGALRAPWVYALAYRLVHVAAGRFDAALARTNPKDWDVAAADLILSEAGARLTDISGETLIYNRPKSSHPALVASGQGLHGALIAALADPGTP